MRYNGIYEEHEIDDFYSLNQNKNMEEKSHLGTLNSTDWKKIGKGALIAIGGALGAYALVALPQIDVASFGKYAPLASAVISILINILSKFASGK